MVSDGENKYFRPYLHLVSHIQLLTPPAAWAFILKTMYYDGYCCKDPPFLASF